MDLLEDAVDVDVVGLPGSAAVFLAFRSPDSSGRTWLGLGLAGVLLGSPSSHGDLLVSFLCLSSVKNIGKF